MKKLITILAVVFVSCQLSAQCTTFYDGFESGTLLPNWLFGTGTYTRNITSTSPAVGTYAFEQTGTGGHTEGTYSTFTSGQPGYISYWVKTNTTTAANGYVVIGDANTATNLGILFAYFTSGSQLRFYNGTGQNFPIVADQWYHIELQNIDWIGKTMDVYMDGVLILPTWAFRSMSSVDVDRIHLYNISTATASYDEIIIGSTPLVGLVDNTICSSDSVVVNGTTYNAANPTGTEVFVGSGGCDSTVTIDLNVLPALTGSVTNTICSGDSIVVNGTTYNASNSSGTEVISGVGPSGCDSTVTINLTVLPALTGSVTNTICSGDSIVVNGTTYNAANPTGTEVFVGAGGCDSTVTINLNVLPTLTGTVTNAICVGDSVVVNGTTYNAANPTGTEVFVGSGGCDSTVTISLTVTTIDVTVSNVSATLTANQSGASYQWLDCDNSMAAISGATNQTFSPTSNGNYAVAITLNGCTETSACAAVTNVGITENDFGDQLLIYPNPTDGNFSIDLGENKQAVTITITDLSGKLIQSKTYGESQLLDLKIEEASGTYLLIIESGDKKAVVRLVKE